MRMHKMCLLAAVVVLFLSLAHGEEKKTTIYGFMDMSTSLRFLDDNSLFKTESADDFTLKLDHINIYFDMTPNARTRFLTEIGYQAKPLNYYSKVGKKVVADVYGAGEIPLSEEKASRAQDNVSTNPASGMQFEWGALSVERAWFQYSHSQTLNLRVGKFITPAGIWNVDHGSPAITPVNQPYETGLIPLFPKSQLGIMETGRAFLGDVDLDYSVYLSGGRMEYDLKKPTDLAAGGNAGALFPVLDGLELGVSAFTGKQQRILTTQHITFKVDSATVTQFTMEAMGELGIMNPMDPAIMTAVGQKVQQYIGTNIDKEAINPANHKYLTTYTANSREFAVGGDFKLMVKNFILQSEVNYQQLNNLTDNLPDNKVKSSQLGFYLLGSYKIPVASWLNITPYVMFERITAEDADNNAQLYLSNSGVEGFQAFIGGINVKLFTNITVKAEYTFADILTKDFLAPYDDSMDFGSLKGQCSIAF